MRAKITKNLISFNTVRRGGWVMDISVFKNKQVLVVGQHCFDPDKVVLKYFLDQGLAADFIEQLASEEI
jgi:hypothetical protein